jgi:hypothetical protein
MTEKTRSTLYRGLMELVHDEQAVGEVPSYFPARDVEERVTKDFLRAEVADLRTEMTVGTAISLGSLVVAVAAFVR